MYGCGVDLWSVGATLLDVLSGLQLGELCENSRKGQRRAKQYLEQFVRGDSSCCDYKLAAKLTDASTRGLADMRDFVAACCGLGCYNSKPWTALLLRQYHWLQV
jgi:hypothetical protein